MDCDECNRKYKNREEFNEHLEVCNTKYVCNHCGKGYKYFLPCRKHEIICKSLTKQGSKCRFCGKIYSKRGRTYLLHIKQCKKFDSDIKKKKKRI